MFNFKKFFGIDDGFSKEMNDFTEKVLKLESHMSKISDEDLKNAKDNFKERLKMGEDIDLILPDIFAVCREAGVRQLKMQHYPVQIKGAYALFKGRIAEMKTGEGKTFMLTLAVYANSIISDNGIFVVTVNDYLVKRDAKWMKPLYEALGLSVGIIYSEQKKEEKKSEYKKDVIYATNTELGFDYLKDNMCFRSQDKVQQQLDIVIIDEIDSVLIDEARTPLIITNPVEKPSDIYFKSQAFFEKLAEEDYFVDKEDNFVYLTETGTKKAEEFFEIENLADVENFTLNHHIQNALYANTTIEKDINYIIQNDKVVLIDAFTGRLVPSKKFSEGLHQAIEAKENLVLSPEFATEATITYQNFFRLFNKISGMTGTAKTEEDEFNEIYGLSVEVIETNKPSKRKDYNDIVYKTEKEKFKAIIMAIKEKHEIGQPVLVGTTNVMRSEMLSRMLKSQNIEHVVLNAKEHEKEAYIVSQAGKYKAVTIATNMAGRGTDIILGGNPEYLGITDANELELFKKEKEKVNQLGGLCIIGTERHESRRIDNQLRGRAGRQGDNGESIFFLSLEDELLKMFGGEKVKNIAQSLRLEEDRPISSSFLSGLIESSQKKLELRNYDIRKNLMNFDEIVNHERKIIYKERDDLLNLNKQGLIELTFDMYMKNTEKFDDYKIPLMNEDEVMEFLEEKITDDKLTVLKKYFLYIVDEEWKSHLDSVTMLRRGIDLRRYGQQNPLIVFKKEVNQLYIEMLSRIKLSYLDVIFKKIEILKNTDEEIIEETKN